MVKDAETHAEEDKKAKALVDARVSKLIFSTLEPKTGAILSIDKIFEKPFNHSIEYELGLGLVKTSIPFENTKKKTITNTITIILNGSKFLVLNTLADCSSAL